MESALFHGYKSQQCHMLNWVALWTFPVLVENLFVWTKNWSLQFILTDFWLTTVEKYHFSRPGRNFRTAIDHEIIALNNTACMAIFPIIKMPNQHFFIRLVCKVLVKLTEIISGIIITFCGCIEYNVEYFCLKVSWSLLGIKCLSVFVHWRGKKNIWIWFF